MKYLRIVISFLLLLSVTACASNEENDTKIIHFAYDSGKNSVSDVFAQTFAQELALSSNGEIEIKLFPQGQLGAEKDCVLSTVSGDIEMMVAPHNSLIGIMPKISVFDTAYAFEDLEHAREVVESEEFIKFLQPIFTQQNLYLIGISDMGMRQISSNTTIETISDFEDLRIRTIENPLQIEMWRELGANPTVMGGSETYIALLEGVLVAQENSYSSLYEEVQKYAIETNHLFNDLLFYVNLGFWNEFTIEEQEWIKNAEIVAKKAAIERSNEINSRESLSEDLILLTPEGLQEDMKEIFKNEVWEKISQRVGEEFYNEFLKFTE